MENENAVTAAIAVTFFASMFVLWMASAYVPTVDSYVEPCPSMIGE